MRSKWLNRQVVPFIRISCWGSRVSAEPKVDLGSRAFAAALLDERVTNIQLLINELMKLDDKQVAYILLRHCIALPKFRFASTELIMRAIARLDCILQ
jgi:hypothetical protein